MGRWAVAALVPATILPLYLLSRGPARPMANPPGTFSFAVLGDAPYYPWEELQYRIVLQDTDAHELSWVLHVGDMFWRPCSDAKYLEHHALLEGSSHPLVYTPGDNEWADCWEAATGAHAPLERLQRLREIYFDRAHRSLGGRSLELASQADDPRYAEFVENARWTHGDLVFATIHLVGSRNAREPFPGRTDADDAASRRRTDAAVAWLQGAFELARASSSAAVVLAFHADPGLDQPADDPYRQAYEPFLTELEREVARFGDPVLLVHGDEHEYTVDRPLRDRETGRRLENFTRMRVPGSPRVGWVRVIVDPRSPRPFAFEERVVPRWKYW